LMTTPLSVALLAITAVALAPLFEEMVFRGFLQPLLSRTFGVVLGVFSTALLFGCLHGKEYQWAWQYIVAITIVGIALGTLRAKTNSIIPGIVMHGCFNSVSVVGLLAAKYITHK
jgi:membrane protease YdiL (CAAX protease family)